MTYGAQDYEMKRMLLQNLFHETEVTICPRADGTVSAKTYRRARRQLCPFRDCRCGSSPASGPDSAVLGAAEPIYDGAAVVAYRLPKEGDC